MLIDQGTVNQFTLTECGCYIYAIGVWKFCKSNWECNIFICESCKSRAMILCYCCVKIVFHRSGTVWNWCMKVRQEQVILCYWCVCVKRSLKQPFLSLLPLHDSHSAQYWAAWALCNLTKTARECDIYGMHIFCNQLGTFAVSTQCGANMFSKVSVTSLSLQSQNKTSTTHRLTLHRPNGYYIWYWFCCISR